MLSLYFPPYRKKYYCNCYSYSQNEEHVFLGRDIAQHRNYSEDTAKKIDIEITALIDKAYKRAQEVLSENLDVLHELTNLLLEKETVMGPELDELIRRMKPGIELTTYDTDLIAGESVESDSDEDNADDEKFDSGNEENEDISEKEL